MNNESSVYGMNYLYELSRGALRRSQTRSTVKEGLAYSLNCFYRLYGGADENFSPDAAQCGLYELVYRLVNLDTATAELKAMWYIFFPYVLLTDAPHDEGIYAELVETLTTDEVFSAALSSKYCEIVPDSEEEARMTGVDTRILDWYAPFNAYKFAVDGTGNMRVVGMLKRELGLRNFDYVARFAERLLNLFPASETLVLLYAAASTGSLEGKSPSERVAIVTDLLAFIEAVKDVATGVSGELSYYRGLCLIALQRIDEAVESFRTCLDIKPNYEAATLMLRAIDKVREGK